MQPALELLGRTIEGVFFFGVAPAGGARTKKSNDSTALYNFEAQAGQVSRLCSLSASSAASDIYGVWA